MSSTLFSMTIFQKLCIVLGVGAIVAMNCCWLS